MWWTTTHKRVFIYEFEDVVDAAGWIHKFKECYCAFLKKQQESIVVIFQTSKIKNIQVEILYGLIGFLEELKMLHREKLWGFSIVVESGTIKMLLDIAFQIVPPVVYGTTEISAEDAFCRWT